MNTSRNQNGNHHAEGGNHVNKGDVKASSAKLRGNRVHSILRTLCLEWMKKNKKGVVERLREQASRTEKRNRTAGAGA